MFDPAFPIAKLHPASYNPRAIDPGALEALQESIRTVGFAKVVIATAAGLIVAGHQRTRAVTAMGRETVPAFIVKTIADADEVIFNQLHNGTDADAIDSPVTITARSELPAVGAAPGSPAAYGFEEIGPDEIAGNLRSIGAGVRHSICDLVLKYGGWGTVVATLSGRVVASPHYALACKILGVPCRVFRIADEHADLAAGWLGRQYGEFSYGHLPRNTYLQTLAQPFRARGKDDGKSFASVLYDVAVAPIIAGNKGLRILDFGCGQGDSVRLARRRGHAIWGIEFFRRVGAKIDTVATRRMIDDALAEYTARGPFDLVVVDSVVNSVDSVQAEADVMRCANAFAKRGGPVAFSGRSREYSDLRTESTKHAFNRRRVEFIDPNGFSGTFRAGRWFYQKFHTKAQALALSERFIGAGTLSCEPNWQIVAPCTVVLPDAEIEGALRREFDLEWPEGQTVGRAEQAVAAYRAVRGSAG